jgi:hypothetical protein
MTRRTKRAGLPSVPDGDPHQAGDVDEASPAERDEEVRRPSAREAANVRLALRFLRTRMGGAEKLAAALNKMKTKLVEKFCAAKGRPIAGLAIRAARVARASVEDFLNGAWPAAGACPHCGHRAGARQPFSAENCSPDPSV